MVVWRLGPGKESGTSSSGLVDTRARSLRPSRVKRRDSVMKRGSIYNEGNAVQGIFLFAFFLRTYKGKLGSYMAALVRNTATRIIANHNGRTPTQLDSGRWFK